MCRFAYIACVIRWSMVWYVYTNEWGTMLLNKEQLTQSLLQLVQGDYDLLNDIMNEYVNSIDNKRFDELESYVNSNLNEII